VADAEWKKFGDVSSDKREELRRYDLETHKKLYNAEYGIEI
jgi:hypothetical protein